MIQRSILLLLIFLCFSCQNRDNNPKIIRLGHGLDTNHSVHKAMVKLGEELRKESGGKLILKIFPNQQLGSERECLELLQIGILDMTKVSSGVIENFSPHMKLFGIPYLFRDKQHAFDVLDGNVGSSLLKELDTYALKGLGYFDAGSRSFYSKSEPITSPKDLEGLKIRVMESISAMEMVSHLGGSPTPISWGELYTALQQDVVDGAENNPPSFFLSKQYEVCKFYSLDEHTRQPDILVASQSLWESLTIKERNLLRNAVQIAIKYQRELWEISESTAYVELKKNGVAIYEPDKKQFKEKVKPIYENIKSDTTLYNLIVKVQNQ